MIFSLFSASCKFHSEAVYAIITNDIKMAS
jgi:hypothetical protein